MDKEKLRKALEEIVGDMITKRVTGEDSAVSQMVNKAVEKSLEEMQAKLADVPHAGTTETRSSTSIVMGALPHSQLSGSLVQTRQGSILDMSRKSTPWVACSPEMEAWALAFGEYLNSKGKVVSKLLQESDDPSGGYLVPEEFRATLLMYDAEPAVVWPRATVWPMGTDKLGMPKLAQRPDGIENDDYDHFAGVAFTWTDEGGTKTETEPDFEFIELIAHELSGYTAVTNILLADSAINLLNFLTSLFRSAWVWQTDKVFLRGDGANKPLGVVQDPLVLSVNRTTASTVVYTDVINMYEKLPSIFDAGAVWMLNKNVIGSLRNERDNNNALLLQQTYSDAASGMITTMLGYPVVQADGKTYAIGTKGDVILGNFRYYYIGDRQQFSMDTSAHYLFRSNKTAIRVSSRLDGQPAIPEAFVVLTDVAAAS